jgi:uncharacterized membrane protein YfcA
MELGYTVAGFIVGFIVGMTGVGGGSLMTPILVLFFSIKPAVAVGTDLLYAAFTKSGGIFVHNKKGTIEWRIVALLSLGSVPSAIVAVFLLKYLEQAGINYDKLITSSLSVARTYLMIPRGRDSGVCGAAQEARSEVWLFQMNDERRGDAPQTPCPCGLRTPGPRSALIGLGIATAIPCTSRLDRGPGLHSNAVRGELMR